MFMLLSEVETEDNHWQIEEIKADILKFISKQNSNSR